MHSFMYFQAQSCTYLGPSTAMQLNILLQNNKFTTNNGIQQQKPAGRRQMEAAWQFPAKFWLVRNSWAHAAEKKALFIQLSSAAAATWWFCLFESFLLRHRSIYFVFLKGLYPAGFSFDRNNFRILICSYVFVVTIEFNFTVLLFQGQICPRLD
jgi:hypothetical protein